MINGTDSLGLVDLRFFLVLLYFGVFFTSLRWVFRDLLDFLRVVNEIQLLMI